MNPDINYWAVLVATVISMVLGFIWYAKPVFGKMWMQLVGLDPNKQPSGAGAAIAGMLVAALIQNYVLAHMVWYTKATTVMTGLQTGFWLWLGFIGAVTLADVFFAKRPFKLWAITSGYQLVVMLINGAVLAMWR